MRALGSTDLPGANQDSEAGPRAARVHSMDGVHNPSPKLSAHLICLLLGRNSRSCDWPLSETLERPIDATQPNPHN